jgi:hypothetical protein
VQVQCAAGEHDAAVTHAGHDVFTLDVVGEGDGRLAGMGAGFAADGQLAVQHDPFGGQLQVGVVREGELAVDGQAAQWRRADVQHHVLVLADDDLVTGGRHFLVRPGGWIGPVRRPDGLRPDFLGCQDSDYADHEESRNERHRKERAILLASHDINPCLKMIRT